MARVEKGNSLYSLTLQPGWTIEEDGFGLLTSRLTFVSSHGSDDNSSPIYNAPKRGDTHPKDTRMSCHRASTTYNANGLAVTVAEYIGIANGNSTAPEVSGRGNMSTDPITTHPKFKEKIGGTSSAPINGAVFNENTGLFINFGDTSPPPVAGFDKKGVRSYLNPGFGISGHLYTKDISLPKALKEQMGKSSGTGIFGGVNLLGGLSGLGNSQSNSIWGQWTTDEEVPQLLLTGVAIDFFGTVVKVSYDLTYARYGWDLDIYEGAI